MQSENSAATFDLDALITQLENLAQNSPKTLFSSVVIDEEKFFQCTAQIRKCAPRLFLNSANQSFTLLEQIEDNVRAGRGRLFGRVSINQNTHETLVAELRQAIAIERTVVENSSPQNQAEEIIRIAQMQAQSIIEHAQQEAQRIIDDARNQEAL